MSSNELTLIYFSHKFYTCLTGKNTLLWNTNLRNCEMERKQQEIWVWTKEKLCKSALGTEEYCVNRRLEPCESLWIMWIALNYANHSDSLGITWIDQNHMNCFRFLTQFLERSDCNVVLSAPIAMYSRVLQFSSALSASFCKKSIFYRERPLLKNGPFINKSHRFLPSKFPNKYQRYGPYRKKLKK